MTAKELLDQNPTIREAVAWVELCIFSPGPSPRQEVLEMVAAGTTFAELVKCFADVIDQCIREDDPPNRVQLLQAKGQMTLPAFQHYLTARLGLL